MNNLTVQVFVAYLIIIFSTTLYGDTRLCMNTTLSANFPVALTYDLFPINTEYGIIYAALVLVGLYVLIITEVSTCYNIDLL